MEGYLFFLQVNSGERSRILGLRQEKESADDLSAFHGLPLSNKGT